MRNNWNLLIVCFLCVLCFRPYQVNAQVQSQKKITIEISNERLPSVLKRLEKLSGYKILFTYDDVKKFTVSGSVKDKSIEQTLDIILANKPLEYHIEDQFITITIKGPSKQAKVFNVKGVVISGDDGQPAVCTARTIGVTGVEMEALTGVSAALLTIYDMCKAVDKGMELGEIHLVEKTGGKSGHYVRAEGGYV